ncbi:MAG: hypothetical protein H0T89_04610 [Deltaproteobacteria bacterium]|nr:hypothetical protein [Deltaproteobacteria bacterium]MDQ3295420.1 hypothetical protein [Myxococcota bacterium]
MKPSLVYLVVLLTAGCQRDDKSPSESPPLPLAAPTAGRTDAPYADDIRKLCGVMSLSGAEQVPAGERALPIANWLAANLETAESRKFLVAIQPLVGEPKAAALDAEAKRVGLPGCALAAEWRVPTP